ncbi:MAG TPA: putative quinol monooxygenase [Polyangiales bacterium]|nr:putative quinol monooxygenase [Polyangiales bacterium]
MVILAGTIRVASGKQSAATQVLARLVEATRAEEGCISYSFAFDVLDDRLLRIFEVFRDEAALAAHWASPHMAAWRAEAAGLGVADREIWQYEATSGKQI